MVVTTYNRERLLADTLRSLRAQHVPAGLRWEIVVVDNNSRDETRDLVRRLGQATGPTVRYEFEPRQGQSFARNLGVDVAEGAVILFTDDDILPSPDWVARTLDIIGAGDLDGVGGRVLPLWEAEMPGWLSRRPDLLRWLALVEEDQPSRLEYPLQGSRRIVGASMAFRRGVFEEFGRFSTLLGHRGARLYGGEEVEFINRLLLKSQRIGYDPSLVVQHRIGADRLRKSFFLRRHFDDACGQAQFQTKIEEARILGVQRWRYKEFLSSAVTTAVHSVLRRPDAFSRQLGLAVSAGSIWGMMRWPFQRDLDPPG